MVEVTLYDGPVVSNILFAVIVQVAVIAITFGAALLSKSIQQRRRVVGIGALLAIIFGCYAVFGPDVDSMTSVTVDDRFITMKHSIRPEQQILIGDVETVAEVYHRLMDVEITTRSGKEYNITASSEKREILIDAIAQRAGLHKVTDDKWSR